MPQRRKSSHLIRHRSSPLSSQSPTSSAYPLRRRKALSAYPTQLGTNAAKAAKEFNVGMEIDQEKSSNPNLTGLQYLRAPPVHSIRLGGQQLCRPPDH